MSSSFYSVLSFFWIGLQLVQIVLCLWIAIIVFRQRSPAAWIAISGAISMSIFAIATRVVVATASSWGIGSVSSTGMPSYIQISQALSIGQGVALMTFLIGILLHFQRQKLESDRIADLEAILQDRQQNPDPR